MSVSAGCGAGWVDPSYVETLHDFKAGSVCSPVPKRHWTNRDCVFVIMYCMNSGLPKRKSKKKCGAEENRIEIERRRVADTELSQVSAIRSQPSELQPSGLSPRVSGLGAQVSGLGANLSNLNLQVSTLSEPKPTTPDL